MASSGTTLTLSLLVAGGAIGGGELKSLDSFDVQPKSFVMAMRYIYRIFPESYPLEKIIPDDGAGDAIGVIIGVNSDPFMIFNGLNDPLRRFLCVFQKEWVVAIRSIFR